MIQPYPALEGCDLGFGKAGDQRLSQTKAEAISARRISTTLVKRGPDLILIKRSSWAIALGDVNA
jgi:hypothetical protein